MHKLDLVLCDKSQADCPDPWATSVLKQLTINGPSFTHMWPLRKTILPIFTLLDYASTAVMKSKLVSRPYVTGFFKPGFLSDCRFGLPWPHGPHPRAFVSIVEAKTSFYFSNCVTICHENFLLQIAAKAFSNLSQIFLPMVLTKIRLGIFTILRFPFWRRFCKKKNWIHHGSVLEKQKTQVSGKREIRVKQSGIWEHLNIYGVHLALYPSVSFWCHLVCLHFSENKIPKHYFSYKSQPKLPVSYLLNASHKKCSEFKQKKKN